MKTFKPWFILSVAVCLLSPAFVNAQAPETHIITLHVNTTDITKRNVNDFADFGQPEGVSNENYTINVRKGDVIIWKGVSSSAPETDLVSIKSINHEGGVNVFGQNVINGDGEMPEVVTGTVILGNPGDEDKYKISFKVFVNGVQKNGTFHIDPKIKINQ